ncbi:MAG: MFS transporter [Negativicutes bacterium]|nr:MFS transporter [Negativicutes bacterium]
MKKESLWSRDFILTMLSSSSSFFGVQILYPVLPLFLMELGASPREMGFGIGLFTLSAVVARPFTVWGSKRWGRFSMVILGTLITTLAIVSYYWTDSVITFLIPRISHGLGFGITTTIFASVVSDILPKEQRGEGMGYFGLGTSLSMMVSPFLGIWLVQTQGFFPMFMTATSAQVIAFGMIFAMSRKVWPSITYHEGGSKTEPVSKDSWLPQKLWLPGLLTLLMGLGVGGILGYSTVYAKVEGISGVEYFFLLSASFVFGIRFISGRIFDTKGPYWVFIPGAIFLVISAFLLSFGRTQWLFLLAGGLYGIGNGALFPALQAWTINRVAGEKRTGANALFYNCLDIGIGSGLILLGHLADVTSYRTMYSLSGGIMVLFVVVCLLGRWLEKDKAYLEEE